MSGSPENSIPMSARMGIQPLTKRLQLLPRVPDFAYTQLVFRPEENVVVHSVGREFSGLLEPPQAFVVLLSREVCGVETDNDAHEAILHVWGRAEPIGDI